MLFDMGVEWGRQLVRGQEFDAFVGEYQHKLIDMRVMANKVPDKSYLIDPQTNLPYGAETILDGATVPNPAVGGSAVVFRYPTPVGWNGVINSLAIYYTGGGFVGGSGDLIFRVVLGGRPYKTLNSLTNPVGSILANQDIAGIRIYSGQVLEIVVEHVANVTLNDSISARIGGYIYPQIK